MVERRRRLSRRALLGGGAVVAIAGGATFSMRGSGGRHTIYDDKTLNRGNGAEPDSLDPQKIQLVWENNIVGDMFMGLLTEDAFGQPAFGAAVSMKESADGLIYTFKIRDHRWSDGVSVTAQDFVFSFQRILDPKMAAPYASLLYPIKNAQAVNGRKMPVETLGVRAIDDCTLEMTFAFQVPYLRQLLTHYTCMPLPKHVVEKHGDQWQQPGNIATNGAYLLKEWIPNDHFTVVKNNHFYDAKNVHIETIHYCPASDYAEALKRFRAGEIDIVMGVPPSEVGWLRDNFPGDLHIVPFNDIKYLKFNFTKPPFNDLRVRMAISMAIDREIIATRVMRTGDQAAYAMVPPTVPGHPRKAQLSFKNMPMALRIAKAKQLLGQAGFGPGNPLGFEFSFSGQSDVRLVAVALQSMWSVVGADVTLRSEDPQVHYNQMRRQKFQVAWAGWYADYLDAKDFLFLAQTSSKDMNSGGYSNPKFYALVDQSDYTLDTLRRAAILEQAEQIVLDEAAFAPVFFATARNIVSRQVRNWVDNNVNIYRTRYLRLDRKILEA